MTARRAVVLAATLTPLLGACGFRLRQPPEFAFKTLRLAMPPTSLLGIELRRQLEGTGRVAVSLEPQQPPADVVLESPGDIRERIILSFSATGAVRELQLRVRFSYRVRRADGRELVPGHEISREIEQSFNETDALAKDAEAAMLYQSMQSDLVQQVMRRLAAIKP